MILIVSLQKCSRAYGIYLFQAQNIFYLSYLLIYRQRLKLKIERKVEQFYGKCDGKAWIRIQKKIFKKNC
jgi:hypothetical protein